MTPEQAEQLSRLEDGASGSLQWVRDLDSILTTTKKEVTVVQNENKNLLDRIKALQIADDLVRQGNNSLSVALSKAGARIQELEEESAFQKNMIKRDFTKHQTTEEALIALIHYVSGKEGA